VALTRMSRRLLQRWYDMIGGEGNAALFCCEERRMFRLFKMICCMLGRARKTFFDSVLYKNCAKTIGFPHKTAAQVPHFKTRPGMASAVPVLQHCQLPPRTASILSSVVFYYFYVFYNGA